MLRFSTKQLYLSGSNRPHNYIAISDLGSRLHEFFRNYVPGSGVSIDNSSQILSRLETENLSDYDYYMERVFPIYINLALGDVNITATVDCHKTEGPLLPPEDPTVVYQGYNLHGHVSMMGTHASLARLTMYTTLYRVAGELLATIFGSVNYEIGWEKTHAKVD